MYLRTWLSTKFVSLTSAQPKIIALNLDIFERKYALTVKALGYPVVWQCTASCELLLAMDVLWSCAEKGRRVARKI